MKAVIALTCGHASDEGRYYVAESYVRCIELAGGIPLLIPPLEDECDLQHLLESADGLLLPGGVDIDPIHFGEEPLDGLGRVEPHWDRLSLGQPGLPWLRSAGSRYLPGSAGPQRSCRRFPIPGHCITDEGQCPAPAEGPRWYGTHSIKIEPNSVLAEILEMQTAR